MSTLLIRLEGPMQSWGTQSRFTVRDTGLEPSKSGVIGLLCAALGRPRSEPVDDLAALRMGVRVYREGIMSMDYHTAGGTHLKGDRYGVAKASGARPDGLPSNRYYLADADFLVGLEGDYALLCTLERAVRQPVWPLYLGRKSFVPGLPVYVPDGLKKDMDLETALKDGCPELQSTVRSPSPERQRLVLEASGTGEDVRADQPVGAAFATRRFALRQVTTTFLEPGSSVPPAEEE